MTLPISVFIITYNEERRIAATIQAAQAFASQIVVVDSGSTDQTCTIARDLGADVFHNDWVGYGQQKRFAEDQCQQDWLFNLDADEVVTPELCRELKAQFQTPPAEPVAWRVRILNVYPGDDRPRWLANDYNVVRLYHRDAGRYRDHATYDRVVLDTGTKTLQLSQPIYHHTIVDWYQMIDKGNRFSSHDLEKADHRSVGLLKLRLIFEFPWVFLKTYIGGCHFTGGWKGFVFSLNTAFLRTTRIAKMLERLEQNKKRTSKV
nr:glycosyltransferase family 2 protein [Alphaproteobacteria bacterium]